MTAQKEKAKPSIRTVCAIAKSPELGLSEEALYKILKKETGKQHMKELTQGEIEAVVRALSNLPDQTGQKKPKRTDEGGNPATVNQRRKIYALCRELGWHRKPAYVNGFCKRLCSVDRIEWLTPAQCYQVIEALKDMVRRKKEKEETEVAK